MFERGSRYERVPVAIHTDPDGLAVPYVLLRRIPHPPTQQIHRVAQGDRLDLLADRYYRDPGQLWRICDANLATLPRELTETVGRALIVPLPMER